MNITERVTKVYKAAKEAGVRPEPLLREEFGCAMTTAKKLLMMVAYRADESRLALVLEERGLLINRKPT